MCPVTDIMGQISRDFTQDWGSLTADQIQLQCSSRLKEYSDYVSKLEVVQRELCDKASHWKSCNAKPGPEVKNGGSIKSSPLSVDEDELQYHLDYQLSALWEMRQRIKQLSAVAKAKDLPPEEALQLINKVDNMIYQLFSAARKQPIDGLLDQF